jgi:RimJ/RimL family protein N-acetyltransferase
MNGFLTAKPPAPVVLEGRYVRLEPLALKHAEDLFAATSVPDAEARFQYLPGNRAQSLEEMRASIASLATVKDAIVFAVIDKATGRAGGRQQLMRFEPEHGVIELGGIYWGPDIQRSRITTEALYLTARHIFEDLGNRRFEWKCNDRNAPSKRAAERFGFTFEGIFRQHMIVRGENRDTAWFSMLDGEWPARKAEFERWLDPGNFDAQGVQKTPLKQR